MPSKTAKNILIGTIPLKSGDEIRVEIAHFRGVCSVNLRRWYKNANGDFKPTPKGINVAIDLFPNLASLVRKARMRAEAEGLLAKKKGGA